MAQQDLGTLYTGITFEVKGVKESMNALTSAMAALGKQVEGLNKTIADGFKESAIAAKASADSQVKSATMAAKQREAVAKAANKAMMSEAIKMNKEFDQKEMNSVRHMLKAEKMKEAEAVRVAKERIRQQEAILRAERDVARITSHLTGVSGGAKHINEANNALAAFKKGVKDSSGGIEGFNAAQNKFKIGIADVKSNLTSAGVATGSWQKRTQELTKSVQLALGPLSGVASRVTALSALLNKGTFAWGAFFAAATAFVVGTQKAIAAGALYEKTMAKIAHQLRLTDNASGQTVESIDAMSTALARNTLASVEGAREAASAILTFTSIRGDNVERILGLSQDMAEVWGTSLLANVKKLGKMMEDPAQSVEVMNEMGIRLTETEKRRLRVLTGSGKLLEAQEWTLGKIEDKTKDIGKAAGTGTLAGAFDTLGVEIRLFFEQLSKSSGMLQSVTDSINSISDTIKSFTTSMKEGNASVTVFGSVIKGFSSVVSVLVENLGSLIAGAAGLFVFKTITHLWSAGTNILKGYAAATRGATASVGMYSAITKSAAIGNGVYTASTVAATAATSTFSKVFRATPWGLVITLIAMAAAAFVDFGDAVDEAAEKQKKLDKGNEKQIKQAKLMEDSIRNAQATVESSTQAYTAMLSVLEATPKGSENYAYYAAQVDKLKVAMDGAKSALSALQAKQEAATAAQKLNEASMEGNVAITASQINAINQLTASYNPGAAAVLKYADDMTIKGAALDKGSKSFITIERYAALHKKGVEEVRAEYDAYMDTMKKTYNLADLNSPFTKAKSQVIELKNSLIEARNAAQGAMSVQVKPIVDPTAVAKMKAELLAQAGTEGGIKALGLELPKGAFVESESQLSAWVDFVIAERTRMQAGAGAGEAVAGTMQQIKMEDTTGFDTEIAKIQEQFTQRLDAELLFYRLKEDNAVYHGERMKAITEDYESKKAEIEKKYNRAKYTATADVMSKLGTVLMASGKKNFEIGKKIAIAGALVAARASIPKAFDAGMAVGGPAAPFFAAAYAASAALTTASQIQSIQSTQFGGGGGVSSGATSTPTIPSAAETVQEREVRLVNLDPDALISGRGLVKILQEAADDGIRVTF